MVERYKGRVVDDDRRLPFRCRWKATVGVKCARARYLPKERLWLLSACLVLMLVAVKQREGKQERRHGVTPGYDHKGNPEHLLDDRSLTMFGI